MKNYSQLTIDKRYQIHAFKLAGFTQGEIALELGVHRSTICRELKRNSGLRGYKPKQAQEKANTRAFDNKNAVKFTSEDWKLVRKLLTSDYSPAQIAGRTALEGSLSICHESIYGFIYQDKANGGDLYKHLRCQKKRRKRYASGKSRRGVIKDQVRIDKRPKVINERRRKGDFEGDTVIGKSHKGVVATLVDRKSRLLLAGKSETKQASQVTKTIREALRGHKVRSITYDNGKEFSEHIAIAKATDSKSYFANPYHSWERGTNENTNGLLRQYFPKDTDFTTITPKQLRRAVDQINHRPKKVLGWKSAHEVYYGVNLNYTSRKDRVALRS